MALLKDLFTIEEESSLKQPRSTVPANPYPDSRRTTSIGFQGTASNSSPDFLAGITITSNGSSMVARMSWIIASFYILTVIDKFTAPITTVRRCVLLWAFEMLEP